MRVDVTQRVKMAAVTVSAELKFRDGLREKISVNVGNNLSSMISGIHELHTNISQLLSELVEREKSRGDRAHGRASCCLALALQRLRYNC